MACTVVDAVAFASYSTSETTIQKGISSFLTAISDIRGGPSRYLSLLLTKISHALPNFPLPHSINITRHSEQMSAADEPGYSSTMPIDTWPRYPSTDLHHQLAEQTSVQNIFNASQHSMVQGGTGQDEDISDYDTAHSATQFSGSAPRSNSDTPSYEAPVVPQCSSQILGHHSVQIPSSLTQHVNMQAQHLGVPVPTPAYNLGYNVQRYPVDPSMMFKR
jgi:hypothetical protein